MMKEYHPERDPIRDDGVVGYFNGAVIYEAEPDKMLTYFEAPIGKITFHLTNNISIELAHP
jgi:hypothetical protein